MAPGFRYHVATLLSVFLALGLGMVIGATFLPTTLAKHQNDMVEQLRRQFKDEVQPLRTEVNNLRDQNKHYEEWAKRLPAALSDSRLSGMRVAIVQTGDYPDAVRQLKETLELAGVTVPSVTLLDRLYPTRLDVATPKLLTQLQPNHPGLPRDNSLVPHLLAGVLAHGDSSSNIVAALADAKLVTEDGDYSRPVDAVILVGGASDEQDEQDHRAEKVDAPLAAELSGAGLKVVAAEPGTAVVSYVPAFSGLNVVTVDDADTPLGAASVVLALRAVPGDYGVKRTARNGAVPIPDLKP